jgi:hypothetical protein
MLQAQEQTASISTDNVLEEVVVSDMAINKRGGTCCKQEVREFPE